MEEDRNEGSCDLNKKWKERKERRSRNWNHETKTTIIMSVLSEIVRQSESWDEEKRKVKGISCIGEL